MVDNIFDIVLNIFKKDCHLKFPQPKKNIFVSLKTYPYQFNRNENAILQENCYNFFEENIHTLRKSSTINLLDFVFVFYGVTEMISGFGTKFPSNAYLFSTVDHRKEDVNFSFYCDNCTGPNLPIIDMILYFLENVAHVRNT